MHHRHMRGNTGTLGATPENANLVPARRLSLAACGRYHQCMNWMKLLGPGLGIAALAFGLFSAGTTLAREGTAIPQILKTVPLAEQKSFTSITREAPELAPEVLALSLRAYAEAKDRKLVSRPRLAIIDYRLPSSDKRLWILDLTEGTVLFHDWVAHGKNSGEAFAKNFSNTPESLQTSLGLFAAGNTYRGKHGYSLRLHGLEKGINDKAFARSIVIHGADYVSPKFLQRLGRMGRSWGCPALPRASSNSIIDAIKDGGALVAFAPEWEAKSVFLP